MSPNSYATIRCWILVKAYPQPSKKYQETVCVAAIAEDGRQLLRLYPIRYRNLPIAQRFDRFDLVEMQVTTPPRDTRPESYQVKEDSIIILKKGKQATPESRASLWLPRVEPSLTNLLEQQKATKKSLGIIKPDQGTLKFYHKPIQHGSDDADLLHGLQNQTMLFQPQLTPLETLEYTFHYKFKSGGKAHDMTIHDWEAQATYYNFKREYGSTEAALLKMQEAYATISNQNPHFIMGNIGARPYQFMIIGVLRTTADTNQTHLPL